jgi:hypothetical protein
MEMKRLTFRFLTGALALLILAAGALAQSLSVTSPNNGDFLGTSNTVRFRITNIPVEANVKVTATGPGGVVFSNEGDFNPDVDDQIDSQLSLNIQQGSPEGAYVIVVTAKRNDNNTVFGTVTINVTLDLTKPKFLQFNPLNGSFVSGIVTIAVLVLEPNFKDYRVTVNGSDIPNNTGETLNNGEFTVVWDTNGIQFDGQQSIGIRLRDLADNEENRTINVTLDRVKPSVNIIQPRSDTSLRRGSNVSVAVDIQDVNVSSVDVTGVEIIARKLDGSYLGHVARESFRSISGNTMRWTGRLRYRKSLPTQFKIVVNVIDRAGNTAVPQEVTVRFR